MDLLNSGLGADFKIIDHVGRCLLVHKNILSRNVYFNTLFRTNIGGEKSELIVDRLLPTYVIMVLFYTENFESAIAETSEFTPEDLLEFCRLVDEWQIDRRGIVLEMIKVHINLLKQMHMDGMNMLSRIVKNIIRYPYSLRYFCKVIIKHIDRFEEVPYDLVELLIQESKLVDIVNILRNSNICMSEIIKILPTNPAYWIKARDDLDLFEYEYNADGSPLINHNALSILMSNTNKLYTPLGFDELSGYSRLNKFYVIHEFGSRCRIDKYRRIGRINPGHEISLTHGKISIGDIVLTTREYITITEIYHGDPPKKLQTAYSGFVCRINGDGSYIDSPIFKVKRDYVNV